MSTTVKSLIENISRKNTDANIFSNADFVEWVNELEQSIYEEKIDLFKTEYYTVEQYATEFNYPTNASIFDINRVVVDGVNLFKGDQTYVDGNWYFDKDGKLNISTYKTISDTTYTSGAYEITFSNNKITTTGDEFSGFVVGDIIKVSGCTSNTNNNGITAIITEVSSDALTFASNTFTSQVEAGTVTIAECSMRVVYAYTPTLKTVVNIATETLELPDSFVNLYRYYINAQIAYSNKEFSEYDNHIRLYNSRLNDFIKWHDDNKPTDVFTSQEGSVIYATTDFDRI